MNYTVRREAPERVHRRRLGTAAGVFLQPAGEPAAAGRGARVVAGAVSRAALDRARPAAAHGAPRRNAVLRCVERNGPRGSPGIARPGPPPTVGGGSPGQGP